MEEKLKILIALQDCDIQLKSIKKRTDEAPLKIQQLSDEFEVAEKSHLELREQIETREREKRTLESDIEELGSKIEKSNVKLDGIKSNKEYQAVLKEIDDLNKEKNQLEDKVLEVMEELDSLLEKEKEYQKEREERERKFIIDKKQIQDDVKALEKTLESLKEQREAICIGVEKGLLDKYDFLREKKQGIALSSVTKSVCNTCHMNIPPQKFNDLVRGDELMTCPYCNRIIYWGDNEFFSKTSEG
ncbi:zinc ribbon domain-containing protein [Thermodesulfobacteriota bacterium]